MNDEAIKKALECCLDVDAEACSACPINKVRECNVQLFEEIKRLFNRQQAENERLKWEKDHFEFKVDDLNGKLEKFKEYRDIKNGAYEREIEKLRAENERLNENLFTISNACMQRRNEAIKEFAERLKAKVDPNWDNSVDVEDIDRFVAEMVGGENA